MGNTYKKLVRDNIPAIIKSNDGVPVTRVLDQKEYRSCLTDKLHEETKEFLDDCCTEEGADVLEVVIHMLSERHDKTVGEIELQLLKKLHDKRNKSGGFEQRIFLENVKR
jgi:predicted house-cleaning noncanonical NTP pyrophosphatase (MazG superfamily)